MEGNKFSVTGVSPKWVKSRRRRRKKKKEEEKKKKKEEKKEEKEEEKEEKKKKVGENIGQLRFVRHHGWRTQALLDQNKS